jgi:cystathionine beta-lyase
VVLDTTKKYKAKDNTMRKNTQCVHSGTKYLGGHSDICCGAALSSKILVEKIRESACNLGGSLNAITCYLLERSLKTLGIRVEKQNRNANLVAEFLEQHPRIQKVYYPGLETHPGFETAKKQMRGFGGMLAFELDNKAITAKQFQKRLRMITPAVSLGGVETIICSPVLTSHAKISAEERAELGIAEGLLRLSVGIEDPHDIIADIEYALSD